MSQLSRWVSLPPSLVGLRRTRSLNPSYVMRLLLEHFLGQRLRPLQSFLREDHRFNLAHGIVDHALVVETAEHIPIKAFPRPDAVVQRQIEQRQCRIVDLVGVQGHREPPAARAIVFRIMASATGAKARFARCHHPRGAFAIWGARESLSSGAHSRDPLAFPTPRSLNGLVY